jgi:predicted DNA-binding ribbon-helix-helix protein
MQKSRLVIRNAMIGGRRTSIRLEPELWSTLERIAEQQQKTADELLSEIDSAKPGNGSLTSAVRVYIVLYLMELNGLKPVPEPVG